MCGLISLIKKIGKKRKKRKNCFCNFEKQKETETPIYNTKLLRLIF